LRDRRGRPFVWSIGADIVDIQRFKNIEYRSHREFYERLFTEREIKYCLSFKNSAEHFAATFAGKEAVYKAISNYININLKDIEIVREDGVPQVNLTIQESNRQNGEKPEVNVKVSLSHSSSHAIAFAVATFQKSMKDQSQFPGGNK